MGVTFWRGFLWLRELVVLLVLCVNLMIGKGEARP